MSEDTIDEIDETQLAGENGDMYLFQWLATLEKKMKSAASDHFKAMQPIIETTLLKVLTGSDPYPSPGRGLRNLASRCFVLLYKDGETRTLFDTIRAFLKTAGDIKSSDKDLIRIAAFWTVGELMETFGSQIMSFMGEIASISMKMLKSSNSPHIRYHALTMLRKSIVSAKKAIPDSLYKDIIKQLKHGLSDKALAVQRVAASVLITMYAPEDTVTIAEVEAIVNICVKSLDSSDQLTRRSLSHLAGHVLAATQVEHITSIQDSTQKGKKEGDAGEAPAPAHVIENAKSLLSPDEMFCQLSVHFNKVHASRKSRAGIFDFYAALLTKCGPAFVESNYALIVNHLIVEIVSNLRNSTSRQDQLFVRTLVGSLLRDLIAIRMLSEQGQIEAVQELSSSYLKRWPALMPGQIAPNSLVLAVALKEVAGLLQQLGNAPPPIQDSVSEPLFALLAHPSHKVRVNASWALRCFCYSTPLHLPKAILSMMESLQRDLESLQSPAAPSDIDRRALGHAYGLSALVSTIPQRPLYVSFDLATNVLDTAIQLLKRASDHEVRIAGVEVEIAWIMIASLMLLGPNFVRPHLPQLLVLWRNALPKPTSKDSTPGRTSAEWAFLLHVRDSAVGAILCFLIHNTPLITLDVGRRISSLLGNALSFTNAFNSQTTETAFATPNSEASGLSVRSREASMRRRIYQCFTTLGFSSLSDSLQTSLLQSTLATFAGPDDNGSIMQAAIASSSGSFTTIWQVWDGYAYGVTTINLSDSEDHGNNIYHSQKWHAEGDVIENSMNHFLLNPIMAAIEHDPLSICLTHPGEGEPQSPPPMSAVVDAALELFSHLTPIQDLNSTIRIVNQLVEFVQSPKLEKNTGRKAAVFVNSIIAVARIMRVASTLHYRHAKDILGNPQVTSTLGTFLKDALINGDPILRSASSESIGRLANISGTTFLTSQTKVLVDHVVSNRDPQGRAGCALAFGAIYSHVGGLAAGPLLKTTVNILMSLANDPHPLVHFWSLSALTQVIDSANLAFTPFISGVLGMLLKLYMSEPHETEGGTLNNANISGDIQAYPVVCRIIDAIITVLGPDIQDSSKTRTIVLDLVHEFSLEDQEDISVETIKCIHHLLMFSPEHVHIPEFVEHFRGHLASSRRRLKVASIDALYQLIQRDALAMSRLGGDRLVEDLFGMLDGDPSVHGIRNVISSWLQQTAIHNPSAWIDLCQRIMLRTTASQQVVNIANNLADDEGQSLSASIPSSTASHAKLSNTTSRWRTQLFALHCLHDICNIVAQSNRREHLDMLFARHHGFAVHGLLVSRVPDLIKMAFTASTAYVTEIRLEGLMVLRDILQIFSTAPDPDYPDALLLEQHQAPITAALTPAFSADSTPEILASAIDACAVFVSCGVVRDIGRMGRILKHLTTALEETNDVAQINAGMYANLSPNAAGMLRMAILSAWAQLEVASAEQSYLINVIKPYRSLLSTQWIASLRDYAVIRADSESIQDASAITLDPSYASLGKVVLLPYYLNSWPIIMQAIANAMERTDLHIIAAMLGQEVDSVSSSDVSLLAREEAAPLFFVVFGLVYEALAGSTPEPDSATESRTIALLASLKAFKCLVHPRFSGRTLLDPVVFREFINLCYRLAMVESPAILSHLMDVIMVFVNHFGDQKGSNGVQNLAVGSIRIDCLKICAYVIRQSVSSHDFSMMQRHTCDPIDTVKLITRALTNFHNVAAALAGNLREDVRGLGCMLFCELMKDESSEVDLITPTLPVLKALLSLPVDPLTNTRERFDKLVHGLLSSCLLGVDEMRGRDGVVSSRKVKSGLLTSVLILTVVPQQTKFARGAIEHLFFVISQKLEESDEMAFIAIHCAKTVAIAASGNDLLRRCTRLFLPALVQYIARISPLADENSFTDQHISAVDEIWKTFAAILGFITEEQRIRTLGVIVPTITLLLRPAQMSLSPVHKNAVSQLLSFASSSPESFREATIRLDSTTRDLLEVSIRRTVEGHAITNQPTTKPQISLRSF
ncbi:armadillo-type protein [Hygrophoropsis aurantiaca]|uniref:Armadillo-type protein n=1 Tax=Hygrophoropsis aurantiaca TaxID=72124 RepID=A0ACB7ZYI2_9AGAM|nr:armadillo-type protein [Hygrophoropsis aurantiaca]